MKQRKITFRLFMAAAAVFLLCRPAMAAPAYLIPGGNTIGIQLNIKGLVITEVDDGAGKDAGLRKGDRIVQINGSEDVTLRELKQAIQKGETVQIRTERDDKTADYLLRPTRSGSGYRLGIQLQDRITGIGTVTYYDPDTGAYGALGHGVGSPDGFRMIRISDGFLVTSSVSSVEKGTRGAPGKLIGSFDVHSAAGTVECNTASGIYGVIGQIPNRPSVPVAQPGEIQTGPAAILSNVSGTEVEAYEVEIRKLDPDAENGRNILLEVTDPRLLEITGGIVQGMSGSPILQNGKLVGAVTHVLVHDPTEGYGILIENMLAGSEILSDAA